MSIQKIEITKEMWDAAVSEIRQYAPEAEAATSANELLRWVLEALQTASKGAVHIEICEGHRSYAEDHCEVSAALERVVQ